ncbi:MAG: hypothetical protein LBG19_12910 [Prevotellaceae bacterium]|jgi:hypothetical protein|nr:hypothetical protein [Prevotellaceae bacterium]
MKKIKTYLIAFTMLLGLSALSFNTANAKECGDFEISCDNGNYIAGAICGDSHESNIYFLLDVADVFCAL